MEWSNRFTLGGFTVTYCTFQMAWEVVEDRGGYELAFRWFPTRKKAEAFCLSKSYDRGTLTTDQSAPSEHKGA